MASTYPGLLDSLNTSHIAGEVIAAATDNDEADAINKIEAALGINPASDEYVDVASRLLALDQPTIKSVIPPYTLVIADLGVIVNMNNTGPANLTIPTNASVPFPIGCTLTFRAGFAATTTFVGAGGVTVNSRGNAFATAGQFAIVAAIKTAADNWTLAGDLV